MQMKPLIATIGLVTLSTANAETVIHCSFDQNSKQSITFVVEETLPKDYTSSEVASYAAQVIFNENKADASYSSGTLQLYGTSTRLVGEIAYDITLANNDSVSLDEVVQSPTPAGAGLLGQFEGYYTHQGINEYLTCKKSYREACEAPRVCGACHCNPATGLPAE